MSGAVADAKLDVVDVIAVGVGRQVEIGRAVEGQYAGAVERESPASAPPAIE